MVNKQDIKIISQTPVYEISNFHQGLKGYDIKYTYKEIENTIRVNTTAYIFGDDEIKNKIIEMFKEEQQLKKENIIINSITPAYKTTQWTGQEPTIKQIGLNINFSYRNIKRAEFYIETNAISGEEIEFMIRKEFEVK